MKRITIALLAAMLTLSACAPKKTITIVSPKKTEQEAKVATVHAKSIFTVYHQQGLEHFSQEIVKPENQTKLKDIVNNKIGNSSLGKCLNDYGFGNYMTERMLAEVTPQRLKDQIIAGWVEELPSDMLAKVDTSVNSPTFKKIYQRMRQMPDASIKSKLSDLRSQNFITEAEANEFILITEDKDVKAFMIIANYDVKKASNKLLSSYIDNPSAVVLDFMKTHPEANNKCSFLKGS